MYDKILFSMGWWSLTFPLGVYTAGTLSTGDVIHSTFFRVIGAIFTCCLAVLWLAVSGLTIQGAFTGKNFHAPCLTPVKDAAPS